MVADVRVEEMAVKMTEHSARTTLGKHCDLGEDSFECASRSATPLPKLSKVSAFRRVRPDSQSVADTAEVPCGCRDVGRVFTSSRCARRYVTEHKQTAAVAREGLVLMEAINDMRKERQISS